MKRNEPDIKLKKAWDAVCENMEDNLAMMLLVLHDEYGFGKERLVKLLNAMEEMAQKFDEYQADGVLATSAMYEAQAKSKQNALKRQQTVPVAEAAEIQNKVLAMKDFLKDRSGNDVKIY